MILGEFEMQTTSMILKKLKRLIIFTLLLFCISKNTTAQESNTDSLTYNLPEIVVTASPILLPSPNIVQEVNTNDFQSWNAKNVAEALSQSVGMNVQIGTTRGGANVWVRGFRQRDVQIMLDGIPISSAYEGDLDLNEIAIENIARIKIIKGTPSVIYGINAMGGVIDIIPKTGKDEHGRNFTFEIGKYDTRLLRTSFGDQNNFFQYLISADYQTTKGYSLPRNFLATNNEDGGLRDNSDYSRKTLFAYLGSKIKTIGNYSVFYNLADNERGLPPETGVINPDYERYKSKRQTIGFANHFPFLPIIVRLYYNRHHNVINLYKDSSYSEIESVDEAKDYTLGTNVYLKIVTSDNNVLISSLSFKNDVYEAEDELENMNKAMVHNYTFAIEDELSIKDITVTAGGIFSLVQQTHNNRNISVFNPQLIVGYKIKQHLIAHGSIAMRTRFPTLREFFRRRYGNPSVTEQRSTNYELGIRFDNTKVQADLAFFVNALDDLIERRTQRSKYENLQKATLKGFEFSSGYWLSNNLFGRIGYTLLEADELLQDGFYRPLRNRPKHAAGLEFRYKLPFKAFLDLNGIYVNKVFDYDEDENLFRLPNYFLVNAKISQNLKKIVDVYAAVSNITDKNYEHRLGFPREGRTIRLGLTSKF